jgi:hypothetical protein
MAKGYINFKKESSRAEAKIKSFYIFVYIFIMREIIFYKYVFIEISDRGIQ